MLSFRFPRTTTTLGPFFLVRLRWVFGLAFFVSCSALGAGDSVFSSVFSVMPHQPLNPICLQSSITVIERLCLLNCAESSEPALCASLGMPLYTRKRRKASLPLVFFQGSIPRIIRLTSMCGTRGQWGE